MTERRAWQKEIDYYLDRRQNSQLSDDYIYDAPAKIGTWLSGPDGFNSAFKEHIFFGAYEEGYDHYLTAFPGRWRRHEQLILRDAGLNESDARFAQTVEDAVRVKLDAFYEALNQLPEITKHPSDFLA